jgi:RNase P/RNase MRP subunit p29
MKSLYLHCCVAIACATGLVACGGNSGNLRLGGSVTGLTKAGLVITDGRTELAVAENSSSFGFGDLIDSDTSYDVTVKTQPAGAVCTIINGKGNSGQNNVTAIVLSCVTNAYKLAGKVSGVSSGELVLVNGSDRATVTAGASVFEFPAKVADGAQYGVTVLTAPAGKTCTISNGGGRMGSADVTNIEVACI